MSDVLRWRVPGDQFEDGSHIGDWVKIEESGSWQWQYDTHEMTFDIYEHDGQFWKLYLIRYVAEGASGYTYHYGGQACRMTLVSYQKQVGSPHSRRLMKKGDLEWVRTYEVDPDIHAVIREGRDDPKYPEKSYMKGQPASHLN